MMSANSILIDSIDIDEKELQKLHGVLEILLLDRTTGSNIIWATNDYEHLGESFTFYKSIHPESITGEFSKIIQPRILKQRHQQQKRSREMAEVFTPAWVCNHQNNMVDEVWFGTPDVFNHENDDHTWLSHQVPQFPENKQLNDYISDKRIEITCGEAPYLVSRYDATTGEKIEIGQRIGLLDRKLWAINSLTPDDSPELTPAKRKLLKREWRRKVYRAYKSIYGFEWQGDNLLLAREALFISLIEYYQAKWKTHKLPQPDFLLKIAEIISWNIWQMDGLNYGIPGYTPEEKTAADLFPDYIQPEKRLCRIMNWDNIDALKGEECKFKELLTSENA